MYLFWESVSVPSCACECLLGRLASFFCFPFRVHLSLRVNFSLIQLKRREEKKLYEAERHAPMAVSACGHAQIHLPYGCDALEIVDRRERKRIRCEGKEARGFTGRCGERVEKKSRAKKTAVSSNIYRQSPRFILLSVPLKEISKGPARNHNRDVRAEGAT